MNQCFAYLMAAGLALAAGPHAAISASPQGHSAAGPYRGDLLTREVQNGLTLCCERRRAGRDMPR